MQALAIIGGVILGVIVFIIVLFKAAWRVAEPNEALIISGLHEKPAPGGVAETLGFKIITGKGVLVTPGIQKVRRLTLDLHETELAVECVTTQGVPLHIRGVVIYKIGDDFASIAIAARGVLDQQAQMDNRVHNVFAGHLRSIVGSMTVEDMIRDREQLTENTRAAAGTEMQKLGLVIDSLQIQEIDDPTGYIENLRQPHAVKVQSQARIATANADQEATQREQESEAVKAEARRDAKIKQAGFAAEVQEAEAKAAQAGPLADVNARQEVVVQETKIADLEADRAQKRLIGDVIRPANASRDAAIANAEAQAAQTQKVGEAEASIIKTRGLAEAESMRAKGEAEGAAIAARAAGLAENQDAVINQQYVELLPKIVAEIAGPLGHVQNMTMLNGAEGLTKLISEVIAQAGAIRPLVDAMMSHSNGHVNGHSNGHPVHVPEPVEEEVVE
jgi:flotillin